MELIHPIFKWLHVIAGIMWIGLLYFFNFVNTAFAPTMDGETKQKVVLLGSVGGFFLVLAADRCGSLEN